LCSEKEKEKEKENEAEPFYSHSIFLLVFICLSCGFCLISCTVAERFAVGHGVTLSCHIRVNVAGQLTGTVWYQNGQCLRKVRERRKFRRWFVIDFLYAGR
jgi:hypothetical protein